MIDLSSVVFFFFSFYQIEDEMGLSELVNKVLIGTDDLYVMCTHTHLNIYLLFIHVWALYLDLW